MSVKSGVISWGLVIVLSICIAYQFIAANKAEQKAQDAEDAAKQLSAQLKDFTSQSEKRQAAAEAQYQASLQESDHWRTYLASLESKAAPRMPAKRNTEPAEALSAAVKAQGSVQVVDASKNACQPVYDQDHPDQLLVINSFQVSMCDGKPVVQAEAAVDLYDTKALLAKTQTDLAEATARLVLEEKALAGYRVAEVQWKKAAKKSRIKRVLGVAEKVGLFAAGVYLGHRF